MVAFIPFLQTYATFPVSSTLGVHFKTQYLCGNNSILFYVLTYEYIIKCPLFLSIFGCLLRLYFLTIVIPGMRFSLFTYSFLLKVTSLLGKVFISCIFFQPGFLNDFDAERKKRERNRPFMEYDAQHEIEIPKAPSFRNVPRKDVDEIVKRLTMPPKERFHFKYTDHLRYNDWQSAHFEKIQQLRETISKFGGSKEHVVKTEDKKITHKVKRTKKSTKKAEEGSLPAI